MSSGRGDNMDIQFFAKAFFDVVEQSNLHMKAVIDAGTSLYTIGSARVKILQHGKQLVTYAVGKAREEPAPKGKKGETKTKKPNTRSRAPKRKRCHLVEIARHFRTGCC